MKRYSLFFILAMVLNVAFAQNSDNIYKEKSGKIVYQYEIDGDQTVFTLIYDNFGKRQVMDITQKVDGVNERVKTVVTEETTFMVNYSDKQVIKFPANMGDDSSTEMFGGMSQGIDVDDIVSDVTGDATHKKGTENVLGKACDIYEYSEGNYKGKYWIHNGYLFKAEFLDAEGTHTFMEAKEFEVGTAVSGKEFEIPSGFAVTDMSDMMQQMQQMQQMYGVPDNE